MLLIQANTLAQSGQSAKAVELYDQYLESQPSDAAGWNNRGNALDDLGQREDALASFDKALALRPNYPQALCNKGVTLGSLHRDAEALVCFDLCIAIDSNFALAHTNRGNVLRALGRMEEAIDSHSLAIAIDPDFANAQWNQSLCRLLTGNYVRGWPQYEWRWRAPGPSGQLRATPISTWLGKESIADKKILLWPEGGDGDVFQFVRFAQVLKNHGAKVSLVTRPSSMRLFAQSFPDLPLIPLTDDMQASDDDYQCSLMSLPLACGVDDISKIPVRHAYLAANPTNQAVWAAKLPKAAMRVGLVWAGGAAMDADAVRSLKLSEFEPLRAIAQTYDTQFISLQKGSQAQHTQGFPLLDLTADLIDWADTAALIANLDLVISCDTSVAHLAAAMGKPTWILSRHNGCWRWLLNRSDSPWYPSVRLFRQPTFGDWVTVMQEVAIALAAQSQPRL